MKRKSQDSEISCVKVGFVKKKLQQIFMEVKSKENLEKAACGCCITCVKWIIFNVPICLDCAVLVYTCTLKQTIDNIFDIGII